MRHVAMRGAFAALFSVALSFLSHAQQISPQLAQKASEAASIAALAEQNGHVRVIVEFAAPVPPAQMRADPAFLADVKTRVAATQDTIIAAHFGSATNQTPGQGFPRGLLRFDITPGFAVNVTTAELSSLAADPQVVRINQDRLDRPLLLQSLPLIGMPNAYAAGKTGQGQAVAIIDTGVQANHEFLVGKVVLEACFSNSSGTGVTLCPNGTNSQTGAGAADPDTAQCLNGLFNLCLHGTHVAGIAAGNNASQTGGEPPNGVAKSAKLLGAQVFTRFNDAATCSPAAAPCVLSFVSDQISALNWVLQHAPFPVPGVVIAAANMSLGGGQFTSACDSDSRKTSIDNLKAAGIATVIAAGNDGFTNAVGAPGCISTAVTIASSDKNNNISSFSNMAAMVDLVAPGGFGGGPCGLGGNNVDILSSVATSPPSTGGYTCLAGTSMAAPHVAGAFAAIRTACPGASVDQILFQLQLNGLSITDNRTGGTQTKPRIRVDQSFLQCPNGPRTATHDFNFDAKSDILWYNSASGQVLQWFMNGTSVSTANSLGSATAPWTIVGQRDVSGDGATDLFWRNGSTGELLIWLVRNIGVTGGGPLGAAPSPWAVAGLADFDADGVGDVLWYNPSTGQAVIWLVSSSGPSVSDGGSPGSAPSPWTVGGTGDFNGDGMGDILWYNTSTGQAVIWFISGKSVIGGGSPGSAPPPWTIAGTGDFNGDGMRDILWYNTSTGQAVIWLLNGASIIGGGSPGSAPSPWTVAETGDFNGDGFSDILWSNSTSGQLVVWLVNGTSLIGGGSPGGATSPWLLQGMNLD
jgi:hypothetical protein